MKLTINEPCNESWNDMPKMNETFKFCGVCDKNIYDFSSMSKTEVFAAILTSEHKICGRIAKKQMQLTSDDVPALMSTLQQPRFRAKAFMVLAIVCSQLLAACDSKTEDSSKQTNNKKQENTALKKHPNNERDLGKIVPTKKQKKAEKSKVEKIESYDIGFVVPNAPDPEVDLNDIFSKDFDKKNQVMGDVSYSDEAEGETYEEDTDQVLFFAEVMPEFPGGTEKLMLFMKERIVYPAMAKEEGVEGNVYIRFTVASDGALSDFEILKSPNNSLSQEALRVVKSMPKWIPGENQGKKVAVKTVVPIRFKLN